MINLDSLAVFSDITKRIEQFKLENKGYLIGYLEKVQDGVAEITGLSKVSNQELVEFPQKIFGLVFNLEKDKVGAIVLGDWKKLRQGDEVLSTSELLSIPVGEELIERVINPLGQPLDGRGRIKTKKFYPIEKIAPGVTLREPVNNPVQTGIKAIDSMIPIGRGQRELIIGDRGTGKTALCLDTIINQKGKDLICIYVAIGQKSSRIARVVDSLKKYQALSHTVVVAANASDPASWQYLAPYAGCAIGEYFLDQGKDALVIYDDLTKHAWAYREISLVLRRPSGREAYPGDIFYLHSRLLERACKLSKKYGGGSLTALPIIETQAGDLSAYIPTNVISITDGQIYLESDLFYAGIRPAVNVGLSVSRVGGAAQIRAMKQVTGKLRLDLAQYRELAAFTQFTAELDPKTKALIERGARMVELLKQGQFEPLEVEKQVALIFAGTEGLLDDVNVNKMEEFETKYLEFLDKFYPSLLRQISKEKKLKTEVSEALKRAVLEFKEKYGYTTVDQKADEISG